MASGSEGLTLSEKRGDDAKPRITEEAGRNECKISCNGRERGLIKNRPRRGKGNIQGGSEGKCARKLS